jgi:hypothetical protein
MIVTFGIHQQSIHFETREGNPIANSQSPDIASSQRNQFPRLHQEYSDAILRSEPSGYYNCHGLVFASRRAEITEPKEVIRILNEDCYVEIQPRKVLPGDIILYFSSDGDIEHSGIVVSKPEARFYYVPEVVSKWGAWREVIHQATRCPYSFERLRYFRVTQ